MANNMVAGNAQDAVHFAAFAAGGISSFSESDIRREVGARDELTRKQAARAALGLALGYAERAGMTDLARFRPARKASLSRINFLASWLFTKVTEHAAANGRCAWHDHVIPCDRCSP